MPPHAVVARILTHRKLHLVRLAIWRNQSCVGTVLLTLPLITQSGGIWQLSHGLAGRHPCKMAVQEGMGDSPPLLSIALSRK